MVMWRTVDVLASPLRSMCRSESAPTVVVPAAATSPFEEPIPRCLSTALSHGTMTMKQGKPMLRVESQGMEGVTRPSGPVVR